MSEAKRRALEETAYLMSIPGMAVSIREGMATPLEECVDELDWPAIAGGLQAPDAEGWGEGSPPPPHASPE